MICHSLESKAPDSQPLLPPHARRNVMSRLNPSPTTAPPYVIPAPVYALLRRSRHGVCRCTIKMVGSSTHLTSLLLVSPRS
ncbi:hypothetical protein L484_017288 [Morus notabilis]|uniref:Uncharacterized protein n=1 Tax=Morus notabilis TaxID=981085 RepID=W9SHB0_9ROSA|nr:hypothetical protein L484_017288 [Morus notabilis]